MEPIRSELTMRRIAGRVTAQALVESDIPLGRDVARILYAQGNISPSDCRATDGQVQAQGNLTLNFLCMGKDNAPFGMQAATQYSHTIELPQVREGMQATVSPQLLDLRCSLAEGRIHVEAVAELSAIAIDMSKIHALTDVAGVSNLQRLYTETEMGELSCIGAQNKRTHEVISAPGAQQILLFNGKSQVTNTSFTDTEALVQTVLYINALYLDGDGQYMQLNQQIPLQETIELSADPRGLTGAAADAVIEDIFMSLGTDPGTLELDVSTSISVNGVANKRVQTLADAYAPDESMICVRQRAEQLSAVGNVTRICSYNEGIKIPDTLPEAFRAVFASARPTVLGVKNDNGQLAVDGILITSIGYQTDDGSILGYEEDVPFACTLDAPFMPDADVNASLLEARASGSGRIINVSFTLEIKAALRVMTVVTLAMDIEPAEPLIRENGILIHYSSAGETFFDIGKRFGVAVPSVKEWNPGIMEPFEEGQAIMLLSASGRKKG